MITGHDVRMCVFSTNICLGPAPIVLAIIIVNGIVCHVVDNVVD